MTAAVTPNPMKYITYSNRVAGTTVFHIGGTHRGTTLHWVRCFTGTHLLTRRAGSPSGSPNNKARARTAIAISTSSTTASTASNRLATSTTTPVVTIPAPDPYTEPRCTSFSGPMARTNPRFGINSCGNNSRAPTLSEGRLKVVSVFRRHGVGEYRETATTDSISSSV